MYRVLIADDEPIERMVVSKMIKKHFREQLEVVQAVNGREAVELFQKAECQIAVLDIEMPGINGLEAAEQIREKYSECCIVFLTAFDEFSYAKKAISVKALDYLLKPASEEELVAVLEEAVRLTDKWMDSKAFVDLEEIAEADTAEEQKLSKKAEENRPAEEANDLHLCAVAEKIRLYIEKYYMEDIALQNIAEAMNYSDAYFCKLFKQCFDKSFVTYLTDFRVSMAKKMLEDVVINIKDVGVKVGYHDPNYFAKVFKRSVGVTPSEYRLQILQKEKGTIG